MANFDNFTDDFLDAFKSMAGYSLPADALLELVAFYPDRYGKLKGKDFQKPDISILGSKDYLEIVKMYVRFYKLPMTIEVVCAVYDWGIDNLVNKGLNKAPKRLKELIGKMRHSLEPMAKMLDQEKE
jgi:hypothetical protein